MADYDLSALQYLFLAGERLDPDTYHWATEKLGIPVIDHWWQTETGWPIAANPMGIERLPIKAGLAHGPDARLRRAHPARRRARLRASARRARSACACRCRPARCRRCGTTTTASRRPTCPSIPGYYLTGDGGYFDDDGYLFVMGRIDDVINVAGHRLSTGAIEEVLATHPAVAECAVIGVADEIKGQVPRGLVVLKAGAPTDGLAEELVRLVRDEIGAVAAFKLVDVVPALPKTRSGKILRKTMRGIADGPRPSRCRRPSRTPRCSRHWRRFCGPDRVAD